MVVNPKLEVKMVLIDQEPEAKMVVDLKFEIKIVVNLELEAEMVNLELQLETMVAQIMEEK